MVNADDKELRKITIGNKGLWQQWELELINYQFSKVRHPKNYEYIIRFTDDRAVRRATFNMSPQVHAIINVNAPGKNEPDYFVFLITETKDGWRIVLADTPIQKLNKPK